MRRHQALTTLSVVGGFVLLAIGGSAYILGRTLPEIPDELQQPQDSEGRDVPFERLRSRTPESLRSAGLIDEQMLALGYNYDPTKPRQECLRYDAEIDYTDELVIVSLYSGFFEGFERYCPPPEGGIVDMAHASAYGSLVVDLSEPVGDRIIVDGSTGERLNDPVGDH